MKVVQQAAADCTAEEEGCAQNAHAYEATKQISVSVIQRVNDQPIEQPINE
jgi:hypothetical protein